MVSAISVTPAKSGFASMSDAVGIAFLTSLMALSNASAALADSRVKDRQITPLLPLPIKASSHPA